MPPEDKAKEEYAEAGVDLPELKEEQTETPAPEEKPKDTETKPEADQSEPLQKPKPEEQTPEGEAEKPQKRSIYDDLKDERQKRQEAETKAAELEAKLAEASRAQDGKPAAEATQDAIAYAKEVGADPALVQRIIDDARKGIGMDPETKQLLEGVKTFMESNAKVIEAQKFNEEFESITPSLKEMFPNATADELGAIKQQLDTLSHTKEWHDKSLDYVAFKNRDTLSALVSPKKKGMETKGRQDALPGSDDFDPNADLSKLTPEQREKWEEQYRALGKSDELLTDAEGRKLIV